MTADLHVFPRTTPGIKTRRALRQHSTQPARPNSDGARPDLPQSTGAISSKRESPFVRVFLWLRQLREDLMGRGA